MRKVEVERGTMVEEATRLRSRAEIAEWKKEIKHRSLTRAIQRQEVFDPEPNPIIDPIDAPCIKVWKRSRLALRGQHYIRLYAFFHPLNRTTI
jgi:hypothetical protein